MGLRVINEPFRYETGCGIRRLERINQCVALTTASSEHLQMYFLAKSICYFELRIDLIRIFRSKLNLNGSCVQNKLVRSSRVIFSSPKPQTRKRRDKIESIINNSTLVR